jgi:hypothetical protein
VQVEFQISQARQILVKKGDCLACHAAHRPFFISEMIFAVGTIGKAEGSQHRHFGDRHRIRLPMMRT